MRSPEAEQLRFLGTLKAIKDQALDLATTFSTSVVDALLSKGAFAQAGTAALKKVMDEALSVAVSRRGGRGAGGLDGDRRHNGRR